MVKIKIKDKEELAGLLSDVEYKNLVSA